MRKADKTRAKLDSLGFKNAYEFLQSEVSRCLEQNIQECVEWPFAKHPDGYGLLAMTNATARVHRLSLEMKLSTLLTKRDEACHKCDNRPCFNPNHLFKGSKSVNMKDMANKGRMGKMDRLSQRDRNTIRDLYCLGWDATVIAQTVKADRSTVNKLCADIDLDYMQKVTAQMEEEDEH
jgi:hypothetical protein